MHYKSCGKLLPLLFRREAGCLRYGVRSIYFVRGILLLERILSLSYCCNRIIRHAGHVPIHVQPRADGFTAAGDQATEYVAALLCRWPEVQLLHLSNSAAGVLC